MSTDKLKHKEITDIILKSFMKFYNELGNLLLFAFNMIMKEKISASIRG